MVKQNNEPIVVHRSFGGLSYLNYAMMLLKSRFFYKIHKLVFSVLSMFHFTLECYMHVLSRDYFN